MSASKRRPAKAHRALMLRTCAADMTSRGGFRWPERGFVFAPDWSAGAECGGGLHGCAWGEGDPTSAWRWEPEARWLVCEYDTREAVDLVGKIKVPRAWVVYCGDREGATRYIIEHGVAGRAVIGASVTAGNDGMATAGNYGMATAGDGGTATAGYGGELRIRLYDGRRYRLAVGYVGEGGIEANVAYRCDNSGRLVRAFGGER